MRYKSLNYYYHTAWLRFWSVIYRFREKNKDLEHQIDQYTDSYQWKYNSKYHSFQHFEKLEQLRASLKFDANSIALTNCDVPGEILNPLFPAYWALANWNEYIQDKDQPALNAFLINAHELINISEPKEFGRILIYNQKNSRYDTNDQWYSGITQAMACSTMIRLYEYTNEPKHLTYAQQFLQACLHPVDRGGVLLDSPFGPWIEEYPGKKNPLVLNGFLFCIIAFIEYHSFSEDDQYSELVNTLCQSLLKALPYYIFPKGIKYCLDQQKISNIEYQALYISQFRHLHAITSHSFFKELGHQLDQKMDWKRFNSFYRY